jgi:hypothetical protein
MGNVLTLIYYSDRRSLQVDATWRQHFATTDWIYLNHLLSFLILFIKLTLKHYLGRCTCIENQIIFIWLNSTACFLWKFSLLRGSLMERLWWHNSFGDTELLRQMWFWKIVWGSSFYWDIILIWIIFFLNLFIFMLSQLILLLHIL